MYNLVCNFEDVTTMAKRSAILSSVTGSSICDGYRRCTYIIENQMANTMISLFELFVDLEITFFDAQDEEPIWCFYYWVSISSCSKKSKIFSKIFFNFWRTIFFKIILKISCDKNWKIFLKIFFSFLIPYCTKIRCDGKTTILDFCALKLLKII